MASSSIPPSNSTRQSSSAPFLRATIYIPGFNAYSKPRPAWFSMSSHVRWKYIVSDDEAPPNTLTDFRSHFCLNLDRLGGDAEWSKVEEIVRVFNVEQKPAIAVSGKFSRRLRSLFSSRSVEVVILARKVHERDAWANYLRNRIAPWQLLYRRTKEQLLDSRLTLAELECLFKWLEKVPATTTTTRPCDANNESGCRSDAGFIFDGVNSISNLVETIAVCVRTSAPVVKESAELIGDVAKCVTVVGAAFHGIALVATIVDLSTERKRGIKELPRIRFKLGQLHESVAKCMIPILHPDGQVSEVLVSHMFRVQEELMSILGEVESQMMRRSVTGLFKAGELCKIENAMKALEDRVVDIVQSGMISRLDMKVQSLTNDVAEHSREVQHGVGVLQGRPLLTPYFVGRDDEMKQLKQMLVDHGSAAIMQMGGAGKTQLMIAFAERAEMNKWIDGGCYWIPANGDENEFAKRLGSFAEALTQVRLKPEELEDINVVLSVIQRKLRSQKEKWMLCLDNADDQSVNKIVGDLCRIANPRTGNGWVLVTSRQSGVPMWLGMKVEQKLKVQPLSVENAMLVLLRWKMARLSTEVEDSELLAEVERLRVEDKKEYQALLELAGNQEAHGLGGLPLALAQAGRYIYRNCDSFVSYLELYKRTRHDSDVAELFRVIEDSGLASEEQRSVWTTWKINVEGLSDKARRLLRSFAILDTSSVPELLVKHLDSQFVSDTVAYRNYVVEELVNTTSLLDREETEDGVMFQMHRLVQEFVVADAKSNDDEYRLLIMAAICGVSKYIQSRLLESGNSVDDCPEFWPEGSHWIRQTGTCARKLSKLFCELRFSCTEEPFMEKVMIVFRFAIRERTRSGFCAEYEETRALCDRFIRVIGDKCSAEDRIYIARALHDKGLFELVAWDNDDLVKLERARLLFINASEMCRRFFGDSCDSDDLAVSLFQLGVIAQKKGDITDSERYYTESLDMETRLHGNEYVSWNFANTMFYLSTLLGRNGDRNKAAILLTESHSLRRKFSNRHPCFSRDLKMLYDFVNHASFIEGNGFLDTFLSECLNLFNLPGADFQHNHDNHINVAILFQKLSVICLGRGALDEARRAFLVALECYGGLDVNKWIHKKFYVRADWKFAAYEYYGDMHEECLEISRRLFGQFVDHLGLAAVLLDMAWEGESNDAVVHCRESLSMKRRLLGDATDHASISLSFFALGELLKNRGFVLEAEKLLRESLAMYQRLCGESKDSPEIVEILRCLASLVMDKGDIVESMSLYFDSFEIMNRIKDDGMSLFDTFLNLYCFGTKAMEAGALDFAERVFLDCVNLADKMNWRIDVFIILQKRVDCLMKTGKCNEAKETFSESLNSYELVETSCKRESAKCVITSGYLKSICDYDGIFEQFFAFHRQLFDGKDHFSVVRMLHDFAVYSCSKSEFDRACLLFDRSLSMNRRLRGEKADHKSISLTLFSLANAMKDQSMLVKAEVLYRESLEMNRRLYRNSLCHTDIAETLRNLGFVLRDRGILVEAEIVLREFLSMRKRMDEYDEDESLECLNTLADKAFDMNAHDFALRLKRECLMVIRNSHNKISLRLAIATQKLGHALLVALKFEEARALFLESVDILGQLNYTPCDIDDSNVWETMHTDLQYFCESVMKMRSRVCDEGFDHLGLTNVSYALGRLATDRDEYDDAKQHHIASLTMRRRCLREQEVDEFIGKSLYELGFVMKQLNELDESEKLYRECLEMRQKLCGEEADNAELSLTMSSLHYVLGKKGAFKEAESFLVGSLKMDQRLNNGRMNYSVAGDRFYDLAQMALKNNSVDEAVRFSREGLEYYRYTGRHFHIVASMWRLALSLVENKEFDEAIDLFHESMSEIGRASHHDDKELFFIIRILRTLLFLNVWTFILNYLKIMWTICAFHEYCMIMLVC